MDKNNLSIDQNPKVANLLNRNLLKNLDRLIGIVTKVGGLIGGLSIVLMALITTFDVVLRFFFRRSFPGAYEINEYLMVICVSFVFPYCAYVKEHLRIDFLVAQFSTKIQLLIQVVTELLGLFFVAIITWNSITCTNNLLNDGVYSAVLRIPAYPFALAMFLGFLLLSLVILLDLINSLSQMSSAFDKGWKFKSTILFGLGTVVALIIVLMLGSSLPWRWTPFTFGLLSMGLLIVLLLSGIDVWMAIGIVGFLGMSYLSGTKAAYTLVSTTPFSTISSYDMTVIPLFILMGTLAFHSDTTKNLFDTMYKWFGHLKGGLAIATVGTAAGFAAVCGSSPATAATVGTITLPEMRKYNYDDKLATGCVVAGGTMGILIPPSIVLIIYGVLTQQSIGKLFMAGIIPGILEAVFYAVTIYIICSYNPKLGPRGPKVSFVEKVKALPGAFDAILLFGLVMYGIYGGVFTPIEAAAVGTVAAFSIALYRRKVSLKMFFESIWSAGKLTSSILLVIVGATVFGYFLSVTRLPFELANRVLNLELNRYLILGIVIGVYLFLGTIMSSIAMIMITVPIFYPLIVSLGFNPIWFAIIIVRMAEIGAITPPVGVNCFIIASIAKNVPLKDVFQGIIPFFITDLFHVLLLILVPQIVLFLPNLM